MDSAMTTSLAPSHVSARENSAPHGVECRILGVWVRGKSTSPRSHKGVVFSHQVIGSWAPLTSMDRTPSCDSGRLVHFRTELKGFVAWEVSLFELHTQ